MNRSRKISCTAAIATLMLPLLTQAQGFQVLYSFPGGYLGAVPRGVPLQDAAGNLYGVTYAGGLRGVLFKLAPDGTETVLHIFQGGNDGANPQAGVISDKAGNLYGMTTLGGKDGCGVVYGKTPGGVETVLHTFDPATDGCQPLAGLTIDRKGNLYGATSSKGPTGGGTVFKLKPGGKEKILHAFPANINDGMYPAGDLLRDSSGNLYGTTVNGGMRMNCGYGCGTVFKIAPDGTETVLYAFGGPPDGAYSYSNVVQDSAGNLIGTTNGGGQYGLGTIFKLTPAGKETQLHNFCEKLNCADGVNPLGNVVLDNKGSLFGTTLSGGQYGLGTIWKLGPTGRYVVLHSMDSNSTGMPNGVAKGRKRTLFGLDPNGGNYKYEYGSVFSLPE